MKEKKTIFTKGAILRPTDKCVRMTGLVNYDDYAISYGKVKHRNGDIGLNLIIDGQKTKQCWSPDYWVLLEE